MSNTIVAQPGLPGVGPAQCQPNMFGTYGGGTTNVPLFDVAVIEARIEANRLRGLGQSEMLPTAESQIPPATIKPASPLLRETIAQMDAEIAKAAGEERDALRQVRIDTILSELPESLITSYEDALTEINSLKAIQMTARSAMSDPAYQYRELAQIARQYPNCDAASPKLRTACKKRLGVDLDEIASRLYPDDPAGDDKAIRDAIRVASDLREARDCDTKLANVRTFIRSIESGDIIGLNVTPEPAKPVVAEITSLASARRMGKAAALEARHNKVVPIKAKASPTKPRRERKPLMTPEEATTFGRKSVGNMVLVKTCLSCGCEPYEDVFTYNRWLAQGYQVQRGQKAIKIPVIGHKETEDPDTGEKKVISIKATGAVFCRCQVAAAKGAKG